MHRWLDISKGIDRCSAVFGQLASLLVLLACLISAGNASSRYLFSAGSNAWLEVQWYMFAAIFLLGAPHTLRLNEHVRVDLLYAGASERHRLRVDIFGLVLFLLPATVILAWMTWPFFMDSWLRNEYSSNAGGLIRWPVKILMPIGFILLTLQGISELVKRIAAMKGLYEGETKYERPLQ